MSLRVYMLAVHKMARAHGRFLFGRWSLVLSRPCRCFRCCSSPFLFVSLFEDEDANVVPLISRSVPPLPPQSLCGKGRRKQACVHWPLRRSAVVLFGATWERSRLLRAQTGTRSFCVTYAGSSGSAPRDLLRCAWRVPGAFLRAFLAPLA